MCLKNHAPTDGFARNTDTAPAFSKENFDQGHYPA
jgi:hypothetical protein